MKRRRFLAISAAALVNPAKLVAAPQRWHGLALGAKAEIVLHGSREMARDAFVAVEAILRNVENAFSLYRPTSELSRLNAGGSLVMSMEFASLVRLSDRLHHATGGLFDPTVQPVWRALFEGRPAPLGVVGWDRVQINDHRIAIGNGQALTFNGIAQGFATDLVAEALRVRGFGSILVNIGEFAGYGAPWRIGLSDPALGYMGTRTLTNGAIATSSPQAMSHEGQGHILHPEGHRPRWSTVSVEADSAALADGLSTALCLADIAGVRQLTANVTGCRKVTVVDVAGNLRTFS